MSASIAQAFKHATDQIRLSIAERLFAFAVIHVAPRGHADTKALLIAFHDYGVSILKNKTREHEKSGSSPASHATPSTHTEE